MKQNVREQPIEYRGRDEPPAWAIVIGLGAIVAVIGFAAYLGYAVWR